jgi:hypothetical protein
MYVFFTIPSDLGFLITAFCFLLFLRWLIIYINKPYSPSEKQMIWVILFYLICLYPCFKIFEENKRISGWNAYPDGVGAEWRLFALCLLLFGWLVPFIGFGLYNKKQLN